MCLSTSARITHDLWTDLPMPREVIHQVTEMGRQQGMPATLTFTDRHGRELEDPLVEIPDDDTTQEAYDPYYDDDSTHTGEDDLSYDTDDNRDDDDDDVHHAPVPIPNGHHDGIAIALDPPILDNDPALFGAAAPPVAANDDQHSLTDPCQEPLDAPDDLMSTGVVDDEVDKSTGAMDDIHIDDADESTGVEDDVNSVVDNDTGVGENITPTVETIAGEEVLDDDDTHPTTESHRFEQAVADGRSSANEGNNQ